MVWEILHHACPPSRSWLSANWITTGIPVHVCGRTCCQPVAECARKCPDPCLKKSPACVRRVLAVGLKPTTPRLQIGCSNFPLVSASTGTSCQQAARTKRACNSKKLTLKGRFYYDEDR